MQIHIYEAALVLSLNLVIVRLYMNSRRILMPSETAPSLVTSTAGSFDTI